VRLAIAGLQHRHGRFVRVHHVVAQNRFLQGIHQWLQLHAARADPGTQRGAGNGVPGTTEDRFLAVKR